MRLRQIAEGILDGLVALLGVYYSAKYSAIIKRLGLPPVAPTERRGFIVIQIDGLSYEHLRIALRRGYAPHLQRLLRRREMRLQPWRVGLPSTTPAVQAGILFGNNDDIPAFRWYDKRRREAIDCSQPAPVHAIQERLARRRPGILRGGSSYMNVFDGDASLSMFTLASFNAKRFFESVQGFGLFILFLLNPFRAIKMAILAIWEYLTDMWQHSAALLRRRTPRPLTPRFRFLRVVGNVILRELQTFALLVDIYRGVPAIYTTYYGYDEVAHQYGAQSKPALRALYAIDRCLRRADNLRRLMLTREYDLFALSDHGMTEATPFRMVFGQTLSDAVRACAEGCLVSGADEGTRPSLPGGYLEQELGAIETNAGKGLGRVARRLRRALGKRLALMRATPAAVTPGDGLIVCSAGPLSHIYVLGSSEQLDVAQVEARFPRLVNDLVRHPGIWSLVGRQDGHVVCLTAKGRSYLGTAHHGSADGGIPDPDGRTDAPLAALGWDATQRGHLARLARFTNAGDLIALGRYDREQDTVLCFEDQWACHGGMGGPQETAFMLTERHVDWRLGAVRDANDLYELFARRYGLPTSEGTDTSSESSAA